MSLDGIVVICHDALLKRLYGVDADVSSLPWKNGLDQLRTIREPHCPMLLFRQLLLKIASAEGANGVGAESERTAWKDAWILMDIKVQSHPRDFSVDASDALRLIILWRLYLR